MGTDKAQAGVGGDMGGHTSKGDTGVGEDTRQKIIAGIDKSIRKLRKARLILAGPGGEGEGKGEGEGEGGIGINAGLMGEAVQALMQLEYKKGEAVKMVKGVMDGTEQSTQEIIERVFKGRVESDE